MTFARAQLHLRLLLGHVHARTLPPPEFLVAAAHERFDRERAADAAARALALPASAQR